MMRSMVDIVNSDSALVWTNKKVELIDVESQEDCGNFLGQKKFNQFERLWKIEDSW